MQLRFSSFGIHDCDSRGGVRDGTGMAQDRRSRIDVDHYKIDADINLKTQSITAKATVKFVPLDDKTQYATFELNGALNVSKVTDDKGQPCPSRVPTRTIPFV